MASKKELIALLAEIKSGKVSIDDTITELESNSRTHTKTIEKLAGIDAVIESLPKNTKWTAEVLMMVLATAVKNSKGVENDAGYQVKVEFAGDKTTKGLSYGLTGKGRPKKA